MWSDELDKRIQDAASDQAPPFQEKDWDSMAALLDKHLPQEKKKRPFIVGFLFLLVGIPALLMLTTYKKAPELIAERTKANTEQKEKNNISSTEQQIVPTETQQQQKQSAPLTPSNVPAEELPSGNNAPSVPATTTPFKRVNQNGQKVLRERHKNPNPKSPTEANDVPMKREEQSPETKESARPSST
ncbi:MAG: hypothetical protein EOO01_15480, partial [Chitinophagaceae bacterium]